VREEKRGGESQEMLFVGPARAGEREKKRLAARSLHYAEEKKKKKGGKGTMAEAFAFHALTKEKLKLL